MRRKYTESEIKTFQKIGVALFIGSLIAWVILLHFSEGAGIIAIPFLTGLTIFLLDGHFLEDILLKHNKKLDNSIIVMNNSYKEYSDDFITNHPELFDRVMLKVNATIKLSFEAHSDSTEEDLVKMVRQHIADGGEIVCEMDFTNPNYQTEENDS